MESKAEKKLDFLMNFMCVMAAIIFISYALMIIVLLIKLIII
jgi:hypothetical protein